jgi:tRNA G18 (ribose-2'-O)-methylase SpoU
MKIVFVLDNIRSAFNVGSIFRTVDGLGFELVLIGITPTPLSDSKILKTSLGACDFVRWVYFKDINEWLQSIDKDYKIYSVEETDKFKSISLFDINDLVKDFSEVNYFVFGHEINGISNILLEKSSKVIKIPMKGKKNSLNVANCVGIVGYFINFFLKI